MSEHHIARRVVRLQVGVLKLAMSPNVDEKRLDQMLESLEALMEIFTKEAAISTHEDK